MNEAAAKNTPMAHLVKQVAKELADGWSLIAWAPKLQQGLASKGYGEKLSAEIGRILGVHQRWLSLVDKVPDERLADMLAAISGPAVGALMLTDSNHDITDIRLALQELTLLRSLSVEATKE